MNVFAGELPVDTEEIHAAELAAIDAVIAADLYVSLTGQLAEARRRAKACRADAATTSVAHWVDRSLRRAAAFDAIAADLETRLADLFPDGPPAL